MFKLALWPTELLVGWLFGKGRHGAAAAQQQQQQQAQQQTQQQLKDR